MKKGIFEITENTAVAPDVMRMRLGGDCSAITRPGQFVNIALDGLYLRRPISVCDCRGDELTIIYKVVGHGTAQMSRMAPGERLDILSGLGNGYDLSLSGERPLLLGGGVGVPPLYWLARRLCEEGRHVTAVLGFNRADEIFYERELRELGADVIVTTVDGSALSPMRWGRSTTPTFIPADQSRCCAQYTARQGRRASSALSDGWAAASAHAWAARVRR